MKRNSRLLAGRSGGDVTSEWRPFRHAIRSEASAGYERLVLLLRYDRDHAALTAPLELDLAGRAGVDRVVLAHARPVTGLEPRSALANDDLSAGDSLACEDLDAQTLGVRVTAVAR